MKKILSLLLALSLLLGLIGCADVGVIGGEDGDTLVIVGDEVYEFDVEDGIDSIPEETEPELTEEADTAPVIDEDGW